MSFTVLNYVRESNNRRRAEAIASEEEVNRLISERERKFLAQIPQDNEHLLKMIWKRLRRRK